VLVNLQAATGCGNQDGLGRVSYEQSGEVFFLPFSVDDVEDGSRLQTGDDVTFYIATNKRLMSLYYSCV